MENETTPTTQTQTPPPADPGQKFLADALERTTAENAALKARMAAIEAPDAGDTDIDDDVEDDRYASIKHPGERQAARKRDAYLAARRAAEAKLADASAETSKMRNELVVTRLQLATGRSPELLRALMPGLHADLDGFANDPDGTIKKLAERVDGLLGPQTQTQTPTTQQPYSRPQGVRPSDRSQDQPASASAKVEQWTRDREEYLAKQGFPAPKSRSQVSR